MVNLLEIFIQNLQILNGIDIPKELISSSIDELPLIVLAASQANGKTSIRNAEELRVKESDRIFQ